MKAVVERGLTKKEVLQEYNCVVGVSDASFQLRRGEIFCVMGLSGSGKSTLIRLLNRLIEPSLGTIVVKGKDIARLNAAELRKMRAWESPTPMREQEVSGWAGDHREQINHDMVLACACGGDLVVGALQVPDKSQNVDFQSSFRIISKIPQRRLFAFSRRDMSHGCIRVSEPAKLAAHVLRDVPGWTEDRATAAMEGDADDVRVDLPRPIPVYIVYATAEATEAGQVRFYSDVYKLDGELEELLKKGYPYPKAPAKSRRPLAQGRISTEVPSGMTR